MEAQPKPRPPILTLSRPPNPRPPAKGKGAFKPKFFTASEYATVVMLSNIIIPKDERSGSASDAGVPEFIDFTMADTLSDQPDRQTAIRGGLAWLDNESLKRFNATFTKVTDAQRTQILDDIAWPKKAKPEMSHGVRFFNGFRDLVASGFWSSKVGVADLQYRERADGVERIAAGSDAEGGRNVRRVVAAFA